ncbi:MAG: cation-transporting P-type ATPase [Gammaproteobacteria bacterium]|nr:cation-transporting P-type ATPase [Gammaproteobacteria bacterium]
MAVTSQSNRSLSAWGKSVDDVLQELAVDATRGLDDDVAHSRRHEYGRNQFRVAQQRHLLAILVDQFRSVVIVLLVGAGVLALLFSDFAEAVAIFTVILINSTIGFLTEWRATRSMEALRRLARVSCVLLRAGAVRRVMAEELVPGDIVVLEAGDLVPADLRLLEAAKLNANESTLTGESLPVQKHTDPIPVDAVVMERRNMVFKGTAITRGSGRGVVVSTGMRTEFGKIFEQVSLAEAQQTPLEKRLDALGRRLAWAVIAIGGLIAIGAILAGRDIFLAIEVAIALSVAAIPEGLPIVATIALGRGMWRMAKRNALITRLSAVETLGATSVILTDKTGTLTENRMSVTTVLLRANDIVMEEPVDSVSAALLDELLTMAALCNNSTLQRTGESGTDTVGDPTEVALLDAAARRGIRREKLLEQMPEVHEDAFDPDSKRMATVHAHDGSYIVAVKGAPEAILPLCQVVRTGDGTQPLDDKELRDWSDRVDHLCGRGLRTIAIAGKSVSTPDSDPYSGLVFHGIVGLEDPAREGIGDAIKRCHDAGVSVVMVTGDHARTARNIAAKIGIAGEADHAGRFLGGDVVDRLFEENNDQELLAARVFSRVTPEQKLKLIDLYQRHEHVVAMTGDGVNDAPALKKADIGIAMGLRGTAVAKEAAAMVLQDDDFNTIVGAIEQGRAIFENIRKFAVYLLSCNISEVLIVSLAIVAGAPLPLLPLQILFLNLVTDVFPALALGVGSGRTSLMTKKPRPSGERILMRRHWVEIGLYGAVMACIVLAAMAISLTVLGFDYLKSMTVAFCTLAFAQLWHVFNMRGNLRQLVNNEITRNKWIWMALMLCVVLVLAAVYLPVLRDIMKLSDPGMAGWLLITTASLVPLAASPAVRFVSTRLRSKGSD